jgi:hypothetical protein
MLHVLPISCFSIWSLKRRWIINLWRSSICKILCPLLISFPLDPNILLSTSFNNGFHNVFFSEGERPIIHKTGKSLLFTDYFNFGVFRQETGRNVIIWSREWRKMEGKPSVIWHLLKENILETLGECLWRGCHLLPRLILFVVILSLNTIKFCKHINSLN